MTIDQNHDLRSGVVLAAIVGTAVDASPSDASYKLSPADADALFLAESAFARKKRYVWSTSVIQDGQPGPDPSINDNDLSGMGSHFCASSLRLAH